MTGCRIRRWRWRATSSTGSTCAATSACSTPAAAPGASPSCCSSASRTARSSPSTAARRWSSRRASGSATASRCSPSTCSTSQVTQPFDAILSTATFHWIADHERLFARLHAALRPGGRLVAQCGGVGQHRQRAGRDRRRRPSRRCAAGPGPWNFATPQRDAARVSRPPGFTDVWTWLQPWPVQPEDPREYFATTILGSHLDRLPEAERAPFVDAVLAQLDEPVVAGLRAAEHPRATTS